eukprot:695179-Pelagomonas_calceolata.AAC.6
MKAWRVSWLRASTTLRLHAPTNALKTMSCAACWQSSGMEVRARKGKGDIAVPAYMGGLAEAKTVLVTKAVGAGGQEQKYSATAFQTVR